MSILLSLGGFKFEVSKVMYDKLAKKMAYKWTEIEIIGKKSKLQYLGYSLETIDLDCSIYTSFSGKVGLDAYDELKKMAVGKSHILVDSLGKNYGRWVILSVSKNESFFLKDGLPQKIDINLQLKEFA